MDTRNRWRRGISVWRPNEWHRRLGTANIKKVKTGTYLCCLAIAFVAVVLACWGDGGDRGGNTQYYQHGDSKCNNSRVKLATGCRLPLNEDIFGKKTPREGAWVGAWLWAQQWASRLWTLCPAPHRLPLPLMCMILATPLLLLIQADRATAVCVSALLGVCVLTLEGADGNAAVWVWAGAGSAVLHTLTATTWNAVIADTHLYDTFAHSAAKCGAGVAVAVLCVLATLGACARCGDAGVSLLLTPLVIRMMEQLQLDPRPVLVVTSVLASIGEDLLCRSGAFRRHLTDELGEKVDNALPVPAVALVLSCVCAYFAIIFVLFKPHHYKKDYRIVQLEHEILLWRRVLYTTHTHRLQRAVKRECALLQHALTHPKAHTDVCVNVKSDLREKRSLSLFVYAAGGVFVCAALVHFEGANEQWACAMMSLWLVALSSRSGIPSRSGVSPRSGVHSRCEVPSRCGVPVACLIARMDLTAPLCILAQHFYGFVLIKLRFPEVLVRSVRLWQAWGIDKFIGVHTSTIFLMVLIVTVSLGGGAARPLAVSVRQLAHSSPAPANIARAATLAHAIGSAVSVLSPATLCVCAAGAQQGYTPSARTHARLVLPLAALLIAVSWLLARTATLLH